MTNFNDLLNNEHYSGLKLINQHADLERTIESVDISETPDIKYHTSPHTFLLTTGMAFRDDQDGLIDMIRELNEVPVAGLGIKLSRFLNELDPKVIAYADELKFPLIEIPSYWKLGALTHHISSLLSSEETGKLYYALDLQQKMNQMLIQEYSLDTMVNRMARLLNVPVMLINPFNEIETESSQYQNNAQLKEEALSYFKNDFKNQQAEEQFKNEKHVVFEVPAFTYFPYYLVISNIQVMTYPFSYLAVEQAINTLSFAIYKNTKLRTAEQEYTDQFFESLINSKDNAPITMTDNPEFFKRYKLHPSDYYQVIICGVDREEGMENSVYLSERYLMTFEWLVRNLENIDETISLYGMRNHYKFIILLQNDQDNFKEICRYLQKEYRKYFKGALSFGIGNEVSDFKQISMSFIEANEIYDSLNGKHISEFMQVYKSKSVEELLQLIPVGKLRPFVKSTLGELAYPTQTKDKELKKTLKIYMENQCDFTKTASLMYVHRNTVKYRINKCEELLNMNIMEPKNSLDIRLAIFISENITL